MTSNDQFKSFSFSQGSIGPMGTAGLPGKAGQVVRVQTILMAILKMTHDNLNWMA